MSADLGDQRYPSAETDRRTPRYWSRDPYDDVSPRVGYRTSYDAPDIEGRGKDQFGFDDASIRAGFVRKVFTLVAIMLLVCTLMTAPVVVVNDVRTFIVQNQWIYLIALLFFFGTYIAMICCPPVTRIFPINLATLTVFTVAAGAMLMVICATASPQSVLLALVTTTISCVAIIVFAMQTKIDITSFMFLIFAAGMAVFIFGIILAIMSIFIYIKMLHVIYSAVACILFMGYLALDIQLIVGGKKYELSPEEYIFAALMLFVDIYSIFIMILNLFNAAE